MAVVPVVVDKDVVRVVSLLERRLRVPHPELMIESPDSPIGDYAHMEWEKKTKEMVQQYRRCQCWVCMVSV